MNKQKSPLVLGNWIERLVRTMPQAMRLQGAPGFRRLLKHILYKMWAVTRRRKQKHHENHFPTWALGGNVLFSEIGNIGSWAWFGENKWMPSEMCWTWSHCVIPMSNLPDIHYGLCNWTFTISQVLCCPFWRIYNGLCKGKRSRMDEIIMFHSKRRNAYKLILKGRFRIHFEAYPFLL
jgi:hypothetical protein